jgi:hypothetical protein
MSTKGIASKLTANSRWLGEGWLEAPACRFAAVGGGGLDAMVFVDARSPVKDLTILSDNLR